MQIENELKSLESEQAKLARRKQALLDKLEEEKERQSKLDDLLEQSDYNSAKDLIHALADRFNIDLARMKGRGAASSGGGKRRHTRVDAKLRDQIKSAVKNGTSMNQAAKDFGVSYPVIKKAVDGKYDHL